MKNVSRSTLIRAWVCLFAFAFAEQAFADILFLDLNNSPKEIVAARRAAEQRGEKLIVLPQFSRAQVSQMNHLRAEMAKTSRQASQACLFGRTPQCRQSSAQSSESVKKYNEALSKLPRINKKSLNQSLAQLKSQNVKLSSVVVSGHDGNGSFFGVNASEDIKDVDLAAAFRSNSPVADDVRSALLWGCYTTNMGSLEFNWKGVFPNAQMIAGFDGKGPGGDKPASSTYLEDVLVKEKALTEARDQAEIHGIFSSIRHINIVKASMCLNGDNYVTNKGVKSIREEMASCSKEGNAEKSARVECYHKALQGCEDVPADTARGELRELYEYFQETAHCDEIFSEAEIQRPSTDLILRLMFDKQVRANFENLYGDQLKEINKLIVEAGLSEDLQLSDIGSLSRKEFLEKVDKIRNEFVKLQKTKEDEYGLVDDASFWALKQSLPALYAVSGLDPTCIPASWVEGAASELDSCKMQSNLSMARQYGNTEAFRNTLDRYDNQARERASAGAEWKKTYLNNKAVMEEFSVANLPREREEVLLQKYTEVSERSQELKSKVEAEIAQERIQFYESELSKAISEKSAHVNIIKFRLETWKRAANSGAAGSATLKIKSANPFGQPVRGQMSPAGPRSPGSAAP